MGDAELVALAVGGDRAAFAALYDRHAQAIHDFLRRMLGDPHDAADALQDTFLAAGARLHQLRDPTKVRAWLFAIARRQAYSATSARRRTEVLPDDDDLADVMSVDVDPTDALADEELRHLVDAAASGLDERDRAVLELHFRHGLGGDELASALGVERNNAHVLVHRVRDRLQRSIGALVVARHGRRACPDLAALLGAWDGQLSTVLRKRVSRHTEGCETCTATRDQRMRPSALAGVIPLAPLPAEARERVLEEVELCSATGEPWSGPDGFPPGDDRPVDDGRRRASRTLVAALLALLVVLLAGSVVLADADPVDRGLPASDVEPTTTTDRPSSTTATTVPSTESTATTGTTAPSAPPPTRRPTPPATRPRPGSTVPTTATTAPPPAPTTTAPPTPPPPTTTTTRPPPPPTTTTTRPRPTTTTSTTLPIPQ